MLSSSTAITLQFQSDSAGFFGGCFRVSGTIRVRDSCLELPSIYSSSSVAAVAAAGTLYARKPIGGGGGGGGGWRRR